MTDPAPFAAPPAAVADALHVDPAAFMRILQHSAHFEKNIEEIARAAHEHFVNGLLLREKNQAARQAIRTFPGRQVWADLDEMYRESNRDQVAQIPAKLAAVGCDMVPIQPDDPPDTFVFSDDEAKILAEIEHVRFVAERSQKQPDHPDLKPWKDLSQESKDKDLRHVEALPEILRTAGRKIIRLR